jgi:DNA-directed RNA polymerase specialized sigma subunit
MTISQMTPEDEFDLDFDWPEPDAARAPYVPLAEGKEQARSLVLDELAEMTQAIKGLRGRVPELVRVAKTNGATWEEIGDALGTSRQAACRTYSELIEV